MTTPQVSAEPIVGGRATGAAPDAIGLAWLVNGRWFTIVAAAGAVMAGRSALESQLPLEIVGAIVGVILVSNLWLWWRVRRGAWTRGSVAGALLCLDVVLLSWLLLNSGGVLNPASVFYLVQIVLAALVLGRTWAWGVTALSVAAMPRCFSRRRTICAMPRRCTRRSRCTCAACGSRSRSPRSSSPCSSRASWPASSAAIGRSDVLRDRNARALRVASLTTVVAGAAHELGTPLATIAVAARELERAVGQAGSQPAWADDARLIRAEIDRCRAILNQMGGRVAEPLGEEPRPTSSGAIVLAALARFGDSDRARIDIDMDTVASMNDVRVVWPIGAVSQALGNLVSNALQATGEAGRVGIDVTSADGRVTVRVLDSGLGMTREDLARAGEPFFTTKGPGGGMGLGLFVARSTVEQLGGSLQLVSRAEGGLIASITLPQDVVQGKAGRHE
jgi:two-component system sensor histidine kinase RegB